MSEVHDELLTELRRLAVHTTKLHITVCDAANEIDRLRAQLADLEDWRRQVFKAIAGKARPTKWQWDQLQKLCAKEGGR